MTLRARVTSAAVVGLLALATTASHATTCDAGPPSTVLAPAPLADGAARAAWLDGASLRWPAATAEGRFRLVHSARAQLVAEPGAPVRGADDALTLVPQAGAAAGERLRWFGDGLQLAVRPADRPRLRALLRGQLLLVQEDAAGRVLRATHVQHAAALDDLYAAAETMPEPGVAPTAAHTRFRLWAPTAQRVELCLYPSAQGAATARLPMRRDAATGAWTLQHAGDLSGRYYTYLVDVYAPGHGLVRNRVTDPYSVSLNADSQRSYIADLADPALAPPGWAGAPRPPAPAAAVDMAIYELHVRDFSAGDATVPPAHRGRYTAFAQQGSDGMRHLRGLAQAGITDLHLLPVFDIATVPEKGCVTPAPSGAPDATTQQAAVQAVADRDCFNWGYDPWHFNAPEGSYASDADDGAVRIREFRQMVMALHAAGLRVGMDVVYNHTTAAGQHPKSALDRIVPGYYHRLNREGAVERSTCCDNTATEHRMMARLMIDSAVLWVRHHRIDAFRFDLMGHQPRAAMERLQQRVDAAAGRRVPLIGEGWNFGEVANGARFVQASQLSLNGSGIATFSDRARDAVRGGGAGDNGADQIARQGWVSGLAYDPNALGRGTREDLLRSADLVRTGLAGTLRRYPLHSADGSVRLLEQLDYAGQSAGYVSAPGEVVNYVENHDNQTLFDTLAFKLPVGTSREDRARVQTLAAAVNAFSQGIAYFHAGQELLRSKSMDRNSYDSGDWFNRLDWTLQDNFFGTGLPPERDNGASWPLMKPLLADPGIKPTPELMRWTRDAFLDLLKIRRSSTLFRLRTADEVIARLRFFNTGPQQVPTVIAGHLNGDGHPGAAFREVLYLINVDKQPQTLQIEALKGRAFRLHPVHVAPGAADARAASATHDPVTGRFGVPARTAVVWVLD